MTHVVHPRGSRQIRSFPDSWLCIRTGQWKVLTVFPVFGTGPDVRLPINVWGCFFSFRNPARSELLATTREWLDGVEESELQGSVGCNAGRVGGGGPGGRDPVCQSPYG